MLEKWLIGIVISFILRQLEKFKGTLDWGKLKADVDQRVRDLVPGSWFDQEAVDLVNVLLAAAETALASTTDLQDILQALATSDWNGAYAKMKDLILKIWAGMPTPPNPKHVALLSAA